MNCFICKSISKYKCPVCRAPYCSVECCKKHKEVPCKSSSLPPETKSKEILERTYDYPTEDTVPIEKLELLRTSKNVIQCLENPHVREILKLLNESPQPDQLLHNYMQEPIFTEFVDACLQVVEPQVDKT